MKKYLIVPLIAAGLLSISTPTWAANPSYIEVSTKSGTHTVDYPGTLWDEVDDKGYGLSLQLSVAPDVPLYFKFHVSSRTLEYHADHDLNLLGAGLGFHFNANFVNTFAFELGIYQAHETWGPNGSAKRDTTDGWIRASYQRDLSRRFLFEVGLIYDGFEDTRFEFNTEYNLNPASARNVALGVGYVSGPRTNHGRFYVRLGL